MCGIFLYIGTRYTLAQLMPIFMRSSHRGPDSSFLRQIAPGIFMGFHRLAIVNTGRSGDQPFHNEARQQFSVCNGEIYNHTLLMPRERSDCAVLLPLYEQLGLGHMVKHLDGDFGFVIADIPRHLVHLGRDPVGVKPLYYYSNIASGEFIVASEIKSIVPLLFDCNNEAKAITMLPAGTTLTYDWRLGAIVGGRPQSYWNVESSLSSLSSLSLLNEKKKDIEEAEAEAEECDEVEHIKDTLRTKLVAAVKKRLIADRPVGVFISGGLDSSLIAGIVTQLLANKKKQVLPSFAIGMPGSPDVIHAQIVADFLGTQHHTVPFTVEAGLDAVREVIWHLETYDITTIRASVPQYVLARYIARETDVKVVLSGEGSDELFGGYLYSHRAPSNEALQLDSLRLLRELPHFDVLRTDRTTAAHGLEVRVPFLDREFIRHAISIPAKYKNPNASAGNRIEKALLRDAFAGRNIIPDKILHRTKNAFSDACGYDWIPALQQYCAEVISDEAFAQRQTLYPHLTPPTKEAFFYRQIFESHYPGQASLLPHYWLPQWVADPTNCEPSAKLLHLVT